MNTLQKVYRYSGFRIRSLRVLYIAFSCLCFFNVFPSFFVLSSLSVIASPVVKHGLFSVTNGSLAPVLPQPARRAQGVPTSFRPSRDAAMHTSPAWHGRGLEPVSNTIIIVYPLDACPEAIPESSPLLPDSRSDRAPNRKKTIELQAWRKTRDFAFSTLEQRVAEESAKRGYRNVPRENAYPYRGLSENHEATSRSSRNVFLPPRSISQTSLRLKTRYLNTLQMEITEVPEYLTEDDMIRFAENTPCIQMVEKDYIKVIQQNTPSTLETPNLRSNSNNNQQEKNSQTELSTPVADVPERSSSETSSATPLTPAPLEQQITSTLALESPTSSGSSSEHRADDFTLAATSNLDFTSGLTYPAAPTVASTLKGVTSPDVVQSTGFVSTTLPLSEPEISATTTNDPSSNFFSGPFLTPDGAAKRPLQETMGTKTSTSTSVVEKSNPATTSPKYPSPNDPLFDEQWHLRGQHPWSINADKAWMYWTGAPHTVVAVIDSGCDLSHPDLIDQRWVNTGEICGDNIDNDKNGYVDDCYGWDWVDDDNDPTPKGSGHGTAAAGIIAASTDNAMGVAGICWNCRIMCLRFINQTQGRVSNQIAAIDYATRMGAKISNNSYGGYGELPLEYEVIRRAQKLGHLFIASAGNQNYNTDVPQYHHTPSMYPLDNIIAVGASTIAGEKAVFSNYGKRSVDIFAPGSRITTTEAGGGYVTVSGTSFAGPVVAGTAGLIWSLFPGLTYREVAAAILDTCHKGPLLEGMCSCGGVIDTFSALQRSLQIADVKERTESSFPDTKVRPSYPRTSDRSQVSFVNTTKPRHTVQSTTTKAALPAKPECPPHRGGILSSITRMFMRCTPPHKDIAKMSFSATEGSSDRAIELGATRHDVMQGYSSVRTPGPDGYVLHQRVDESQGFMNQRTRQSLNNNAPEVPALTSLPSFGLLNPLFTLARHWFPVSSGLLRSF